mgnify:CR=1 FL=1
MSISIENLLGTTVKAIKILFCLFLLLPSLVLSEQIAFSKQQQGDQYTFNYQWLDHNNKSQSMSFALTKSALFERFRMLRAYQSEFAEKAIMRTVKKQLREQPLNGAQAFFVKQDGRMTVQVKGLEDKNVALAYQKVKEMEQEAFNLYFKNNYYQLFTNHDQQAGVKVDHVNIANDSIADFKVLKPIILDTVAIENIRKVTNYVLSFVQSIPYSTLESRITSSGAGFNPPAKLLWENQGDCDSKMTLTATILRALMPRIDMAMIYIDQHAFIGIAIPAEAGEITIEHQGISYLLGEPTGPALYQLGQLAPESELAVNQGRYVAENFHSDGSY